MLREEFNALAKQGFNRIPLVKEVLADLETPLSLYIKLSQAFGNKNTYLLESVLGGERFGRLSFIGLPAKTIIRTVGSPTQPINEVVTGGKVVETNTDNPLDFVDAYFKRFQVAVQTGLPRFLGV
jgi:anthranilate synthase component 1